MIARNYHFLGSRTCNPYYQPNRDWGAVFCSEAWREKLTQRFISRTDCLWWLKSLVPLRSLNSSRLLTIHAFSTCRRPPFTCFICCNVSRIIVAFQDQTHPWNIRLRYFLIFSHKNANAWVSLSAWRLNDKKYLQIYLVATKNYSNFIISISIKLKAADTSKIMQVSLNAFGVRSWSVMQILFFLKFVMQTNLVYLYFF